MSQPQLIVTGKFSGSGNYGGTPQSLAAAIDTSGATEIYIFVMVYNTTPPTAVTDTKGNTYSLQGSALNVNTGPGILCCYRATGVTVGSGHNFSVTPAGNFGLTFLVVAVGPSGGGSLTSTTWATTSDATSPHTSSSVTVPAEGALVLSAGSYDAAGGAGTFNWSGSGFTEQVFEKGAGLWLLSAATRVETTPGSLSASFTSAGTPPAGGLGIIMITEGAAGGGSSASRMALQGVG
jgi:hypothetical protein